jgi:hypothetical protein
LMSAIATFELAGVKVPFTRFYPKETPDK